MSDDEVICWHWSFCYCFPVVPRKKSGGPAAGVLARCCCCKRNANDLPRRSSGQQHLVLHVDFLLPHLSVHPRSTIKETPASVLSHMCRQGFVCFLLCCRMRVRDTRDAAMEGAFLLAMVPNSSLLRAFHLVLSFYSPDPPPLLSYPSRPEISSNYSCVAFRRGGA